MIGRLIGLFWPEALGVAALLLLLYVCRRPAVARTVIPVGSALLAVSGRKTEINQQIVVLPDWAFVGALIAGFCLVLVGLIALVVPFRDVTEWVTSLFEPPRFRCRAAKQSELEQLHEFAHGFFGDSIATVERMRQWYRKNSQLFYLVHESTVRNGRTTAVLVGFFDLIPVTKRAAELLEREELSGATFTDQDIVKRNGRPAAVYVAGIAARGFRAKAWILGTLEERLEGYRSRDLTIYSRPVTKTGLRLVKKHDFVPVSSLAGRSDLSRIYRLEAQAGNPD